MNILIDTHIALWSLYDSDRLSQKSISLLKNCTNTIYFSLVTAWEIQIKNSIGKLPMSAEEFIRDCENMGFLSLPVRKEHIIELQNIPYLDNNHKDPFDRMLISQAMFERMSFLTEDKKIHQYHYHFILPVI